MKDSLTNYALHLVIIGLSMSLVYNLYVSWLSLSQWSFSHGSIGGLNDFVEDEMIWGLSKLLIIALNELKSSFSNFILYRI